VAVPTQPGDEPETSALTVTVRAVQRRVPERLELRWTDPVAAGRERKDES
jgi:hypothetical protein